MTTDQPAGKRQRQERPAESVAEQASVQGGSPPPPSNVRTVRLPGREVNPQRARLWQDLGTNSALFDVTLQAANCEVPCNRHMFILAEESPFFEAKFRSAEFAQSNGTVELSELDGHILQEVVGSLFTAHLAVSQDTMRDVLHAAHLLQLLVVKSACAELIQETLNEETLPGSLELADRYALTELRAAVLAYVKSTFFLMHRTSLRGLERDMLLELLSADDLTVFSEMQVFRSILAWCDEHTASAEFPAMFSAVRTHHLETFECRSLLAHPLVSGSTAANVIIEALLTRLEGGRSLSNLPRRDGRRFVWAIDPWSRLSQQRVVRSPEFGLAGSERTWALSYTHDKLGFHLTCVAGGDDDNEDHVPYSPMSQEAAQEEVQLTMVLYDQADYNAARRWRLPKRTIMPGEYQGFDEFFKDVDDWVRNDRLVVGVQLRLVGRPEDPLDEDDAASAHEPHTGGFVGDLQPLTEGTVASHNHASS